MELDTLIQLSSPVIVPVLSLAAAWGVVRAESAESRRRLDAVEGVVVQLHAQSVTVARVDTAVAGVAHRLDRIERILDRSGNNAG